MLQRERRRGLRCGLCRTRFASLPQQHARVYGGAAAVALWHVVATREDVSPVRHARDVGHGGKCWHRQRADVVPRVRNNAAAGPPFLCPLLLLVGAFGGPLRAEGIVITMTGSNVTTVVREQPAITGRFAKQIFLDLPRDVVVVVAIIILFHRPVVFFLFGVACLRRRPNSAIILLR